MSVSRALVSVCLAHLLVACSTLNDGPPEVDHTPTPPASEPVAAPLLPEPTFDLPLVTAIETPGVWQTLRAGFGLTDAAQPEQVAVALDWFLGQPRLLSLIESRAPFYLPFVIEQVQARQLPLELALMPVIESTLNPYAFSPGGAAGLWQLIPATARRFDVEMNYWYDGRRDLLDSTEAALDYLEYLHGLFDDWVLAIAAYNAGEGRIRRGWPRAGDDATFWDLRVPRETANYVPRVLALAQIVSDPGAHSVELAPMEMLTAFTSRDLGAQIDLTDLAQRAEIPMPDLFRLNPGLNYGATPPEASYRLLMPASHAGRLQDVLAEYPAESVQWEHYTVQAGDTLSEIAARHATSVSAIRQANDLHGHLIGHGDRLLIPHPRIAADALPQNPMLVSNRATTHYRVAAGDSLWLLARRFDTTVSTLVRLNRLNPRAPLQIGQRLSIPSSAALRKLSYRVRSGDSLARIAQRFNVAISDIVAWNDLNRNDYLQPGQRLLIYVDIRSHVT